MAFGQIPAGRRARDRDREISGTTSVGNIVDGMNIVFIVGAGRSGTTWLQMMLGAHPAIATGQESQIFHNYLRKLHEQWQRELDYPETNELRKHGITSYIDDDRFTELMRHFAIGVFENIFVAKPGASMFLEKSPNNSFNIDLIVRCLPDARFIHVIRDGRDVVTSMLAAKKSWGRHWAPEYAADAASEWQRAVTESSRLGGLSDHYIEVKYEELLSNGPDELRRVFGFLELPLEESHVFDIYDRFAFSKLQTNQYERDVFLNTGIAKASGTADRPEPKGFFRKGIAGDWQEYLSASQLREVYWVAGKTLKALGYAQNSTVVSQTPWSIRRRRVVSGAKRIIRAFGARLLS